MSFSLSLTSFCLKDITIRISIPRAAKLYEIRFTHYYLSPTYDCDKDKYLIQNF